MYVYIYKVCVFACVCMTYIYNWLIIYHLPFTCTTTTATKNNNINNNNKSPNRRFEVSTIEQLRLVVTYCIYMIFYMMSLRNEPSILRVLQTEQTQSQA